MKEQVTDRRGECDGGRVFAVIDHVEDDIHEDTTGTFNVAAAWTQD